MTHKNLYILGTRGIPSSYGGFETFAEALAVYLQDKDWQVTVYCQSKDPLKKITEDQWQGITRIHIAPVIFGKLVEGALGVIWFDLRCILHALRRDKSALWLTLGYNTGMFNVLPWLWRRKQVINMDGVEWQRYEHNIFIRLFLYFNYFCAGLIGDILIADHPEIKKLLDKHFKETKTKMIAYGSHEVLSANSDILRSYNLVQDQYAIVIARPVPENNILTIVKAWSQQPRRLKLVVLGNYNAAHPYHRQVVAAASPDVIFTGAIFYKETVQALRFFAKAYMHGHTVGGTNPSLVETLGAGSALVAHDNPYNRWVAGDAAVYFQDEDELAALIARLENDTLPLIEMRKAARDIHHEKFQWEFILRQYEDVFTKLNGQELQHKNH